MVEVRYTAPPLRYEGTLPGGVQVVLDARGGDALHSDLKPATQATDYGVWSTTHLLGMAYAGEQAYILWLLDDSEDYRRIALVLLHRYVYVVEVLMVGCGWSVKRPKELLGLLGGRKAVEARLAEAWGADEAIAKEDAIEEDGADVCDEAQLRELSDDELGIAQVK